MKNNVLDTFRCSCTEKGRRCASDFTRANAFAFSLETIMRKENAQVTIQTIAKYAICPFHAAILKPHRRDIALLDDVVAKFSALKQERKRQEIERQQAAAEKVRRYNRWRTATTTVMEVAMKSALT